MLLRAGRESQSYLIRPEDLVKTGGHSNGDWGGGISNGVQHMNKHQTFQIKGDPTEARATAPAQCPSVGHSRAESSGHSKYPKIVVESGQGLTSSNHAQNILRHRQFGDVGLLFAFWDEDNQKLMNQAKIVLNWKHQMT